MLLTLLPGQLLHLKRWLGVKFFPTSNTALLALASLHSNWAAKWLLIGKHIICWWCSVLSACLLHSFLYLTKYDQVTDWTVQFKLIRGIVKKEGTFSPNTGTWCWGPESAYDHNTENSSLESSECPLRLWQDHQILIPWGLPLKNASNTLHRQELFVWTRGHRKAQISYCSPVS